jgi:peptidoglycan hydrolase-like protein with peptidoglycan-binding domain
VGNIDGVIGASTRVGVRDMQKKLGLPADGYPTPQLLAALQGGR